MSKPKLLFHSNSPWVSTGYGVECGLFAPRLAKHYDLKVSSFYGLEGSPMDYRGPLEPNQIPAAMRNGRI